jgi:hypothetical protein
VSYGHLLTTQANAVLTAIKKNGLDPEDFTWELKATPTLRHIASGYFFTFQLVDYGEHQGEYCPGDDTAYEDRRGGDWEGQLSLVESWLTNLKREIQAPDLWSLSNTQVQSRGRRDCAKSPGIPPTAVGGLFRCCLPDGRPDPFLESHPREWVDRSGAAYNRGGPTLRFWLSLSPRAARERGKTGTSGAPLLGWT